MTVAECQKRMSVQEFFEWVAFYQLEPWGEVRADYRSAIVSTILANSNRAKNTPPFKPLDFMPFVHKKEKMSQQDIKSTLTVFANMVNKKYKK